MSAILKLVFITTLMVCLTSGKPATGGSNPPNYTTKYDNINIDSLLANRRLTDTYVKCLLDQGRCNDEAKTLKAVLPEALITDCAKCSEVQRVSVDKVMRHLIKARKPDFDALTKKYDPKGEFRVKYQKYLQAV